jgi:hypothetical protein
LDESISKTLDGSENVAESGACLNGWETVQYWDRRQGYYLDETLPIRKFRWNIFGWIWILLGRWMRKVHYCDGRQVYYVFGRNASN